MVVGIHVIARKMRCGSQTARCSEGEYPSFVIACESHDLLYNLRVAQILHFLFPYTSPIIRYDDMPDFRALAKGDFSAKEGGIRSTVTHGRENGTRAKLSNNQYVSKVVSTNSSQSYELR